LSHRRTPFLCLCTSEEDFFDVFFEPFIIKTIPEPLSAEDNPGKRVLSGNKNYSFFADRIQNSYSVLKFFPVGGLNSHGSCLVARLSDPKNPFQTVLSASRITTIS
jgi:hypothetical protein